MVKWNSVAVVTKHRHNFLERRALLKLGDRQNRKSRAVTLDIVSRRTSYFLLKVSLQKVVIHNGHDGKIEKKFNESF